MSVQYGKVSGLWVKNIDAKSEDTEILFTSKRFDAVELNEGECKLLLKEMPNAKIIKMEIKEVDVTEFVRQF